MWTGRHVNQLTKHIKLTTGCNVDGVPSGVQTVNRTPLRPVVKVKLDFENRIIITVPHPVLKSNFTLTTGRRGVRFTDCTPDGTPSTLHPVFIIQTGWLPCLVLRIKKNENQMGFIQVPYDKFKTYTKTKNLTSPSFFATDKHFTIVGKSVLPFNHTSNIQKWYFERGIWEKNTL